MVKAITTWIRMKAGLKRINNLGNVVPTDESVESRREQRLRTS